MRIEQIAIDYANNRKALLKCKDELYKYNFGLWYVDEKLHDSLHEVMQSIREIYRTDFGGWDGWVNAVIHSEYDEKTPEYEVATIYDERRKLNIEAGKIKRRLYDAGIGLINENN